MRSLSVSQIPPSHQSKGKPCLRTHYAHEPLPRDIPPSAALSALSAPPSAQWFGYPSACHHGIGRRCSILRCSRCCDPCSGRLPLLLICPRGCFRHGKSRNDNRCKKATLTMPTVDVGYGVVATFSGRATMNDDFLDLAHNIIIYNVQCRIN